MASTLTFNRLSSACASVFCNSDSLASSHSLTAVYSSSVRKSVVPFQRSVSVSILKYSVYGLNLHDRYQSPSNKFRTRMSVSSDVVLEKSTGISLPTYITMPGSSNKIVLLGAGVREKKIAFLNVKVYAVGLYAQESIFSDLSSFKGKTISELECDASFFKSILDAPVEKSILIILARDVEGDQFWSALNESMAPRLKSANAGKDGEDALKQFGAIFSDKSLKKGTHVYLTWAQPTSLMVSISDNGTDIPSEALATIDSPPLLSVLFDLYLGEDCVSPSLKSSIAEISKSL